MKKIIYALLIAAALWGTSPSPSYSQEGADESAAVSKLSTDLDKVIKTQQEIIQRLNEMKEELYVIKIRASR